MAMGYSMEYYFHLSSCYQVGSSTRTLWANGVICRTSQEQRSLIELIDKKWGASSSGLTLYIRSNKTSTLPNVTVKFCGAGSFNLHSLCSIVPMSHLPSPAEI